MIAYVPCGPGLVFLKHPQPFDRCCCRSHRRGGDWDGAVLAGLEDSPAGMMLQRHNSKGLVT